MSIQLEQLSHRYLPGTAFEKVSLDNLHLQIRGGTCTGIVGHSGSGKSTLLQMINGLLKPSCGRLLLDGADIAAMDMRTLRGKTGLVFQHPEQQIFGGTVYQEVALGLSSQGFSATETRDRVTEAILAVGLDRGCLEKSPFRLSGGEKRRVAIAGILVMSPEIMLLDEPLAGLDPPGRKAILGILDRLRSSGTMTLILASHCLEDIVQVTDRTVLLANGRLIAEGDTRDLAGDLPALEEAGVAAPSIRRLMIQLKARIPEIDDRVLTVEEARQAISRHLSAKGNRETVC